MGGVGHKAQQDHMMSYVIHSLFITLSPNGGEGVVYFCPDANSSSPSQIAFAALSTALTEAVAMSVSMPTP